MTFLKALRQLVLGETWTLPVGVVSLLFIGVVGREIAPGLWRDAGGLVLLAGTVGVLAVSVARGARRA